MDGTLRDERIPLESTRERKNRAIGDAIERWVCARYGYTHTPATHYDARARDATPVQIKGATWMMDNGPRNAAGRFCFYESDHQWLKENNGLYTVAVYEPKGDGYIFPVFARKLFPEQLDAILGGIDWYDCDAGGTTDDKRDGGHKRVAWTKVFPDEVGL